jgi:hypothetical protein
MKTKTIRYDCAIHSIGPCVAILSVSSDKPKDRHQTTIKAATEEELIAKLYKDHGLLPCPVKEGIFRTPAECERVRKEWQGPTDKTVYARAIGYTDAKRVIVVDGKVTSHRNLGWFDFCERLHNKKQTV